MPRSKMDANSVGSGGIAQKGWNEGLRDDCLNQREKEAGRISASAAKAFASRTPPSAAVSRRFLQWARMINVVLSTSSPASH
jgi:hypothetical protein